MKDRVIVVEGIIGAGKTTFSRALADALGKDTLMLEEPDERGGGNPFLADYYKDPARWALSLQTHMLHARFRYQKLAQEYTLCGLGSAVLDRSYMGDTAFARLQLKQGYMTEIEYASYVEAYRTMTCSVLLPAVCINLRVSPLVALGRIQKRAAERPSREFESAVTLEYLEGLDQEICHMVDVLKGQGVLVMDVPWDFDRSTDEERAGAIKEVACEIQEATQKDYFDFTDDVLTVHRRLAIKSS